MPTNHNRKRTETSDSNFDFDAMLKRFSDPTNMPSKDKLEAMNQEMKDSFTELTKMIVMSCYLLKARHDAFLKAGFTEEQTMDLLKAGR